MKQSVARRIVRRRVIGFHPPMTTQGVPTFPAASLRARVLLVVLAVASLGLLSAIDDRVAQLLGPDGLRLTFARAPSLALCGVLYFATSVSAPWRGRRSETPWLQVLGVSLAWLTVRGLFVFVLGRQATHVSVNLTALGYAAFGLSAEELLFRGALFQLARGARPSRPLFPIAVTAVCFGLSHFSYHHFAFTDASMRQVVTATLFGGVLGWVRLRTDSLWPGTVLHALSNALSFIPRG
jgi:membrane protease YdiL (CAAX protease family)